MIFMRSVLILALAINSTINSTTGAFANEQKNKEQSISQSMNFLVGVWQSTDPKINLTECWGLSKDGYLSGFRRMSDPLEYDFFAIQHSAIEDVVYLRKMSDRLKDEGPVNRIAGKCKDIEKTHATISFNDLNGMFSLTSSYALSSPNLLKVKIETSRAGQNSKQQTVLLKKVE